MHRERVDSEAIRSVGYDPRRRVLEIEFHSREVYRYFDVPPTLHADLMRAPSLGQFFADEVRNAGFEYEHLESEDE